MKFILSGFFFKVDIFPFRCLNTVIDAHSTGWTSMPSGTEHDGNPHDEHDLLAAEKTPEEMLEIEFTELKAHYYRFILRKVDEEVFRKIQKIPEDWADYAAKTSGYITGITEDQKKRLSDIKRYKSWELRFESLYISHLITIEEVLIACLNHRRVSTDRLDEALDSANCVLTEIGGSLMNFKHLLLSLAKRAVSDLYYFIIAFQRFHAKTPFDFDTQFHEFCTTAISALKEFSLFRDHLALLNEYRSAAGNLFPGSSNAIGWKMDEFAVKKFIEEHESREFIVELKKVVTVAYLMKKKLKTDHEFLTYYYNDNDGKMWRYNYIAETLHTRMNEGKIAREVFDGYAAICEKFLEIKRLFESKGLPEFGPAGFSYSDILEFTYKMSKLLEFYYLRAMRYDELQNLRNEILYYVENEYMHLKS